MGCAASKPLANTDPAEIAATFEKSVQSTESCLDERPPSPDRLVPGAALPEDEERRRLQALMDCRVLDTPDEHRYDAITRLLASCFKVPVAVVGLIAEDRLWLKSLQGLEERGGKRLHSFCDASLRLPCPTMMVVPDALQDSRFQHNQFVNNPPYVRFYCGAPLVSSEGHVLGSLAVMDIKPRTVPAEIACLITNFAELVVRELEKDKVGLLRQRKQAVHLRTVRALSAFDEAVLLCDVNEQGWPVKFVNAQWGKLTGVSEAACLQAGFWSLFHFAKDADAAQMLYAYAAIQEQQPFALHLAAGPGPPRQAGSTEPAPPTWLLEFRPATADHLSQKCPLIAIPNFLTMGLQDLKAGEERVAVPTGLYFAILQPAPAQEASGQPPLKLLQDLDSDLETPTIPTPFMPPPGLRVQLPRSGVAVGTNSEPQTPVIVDECRPPIAASGISGPAPSTPTSSIFSLASPPWSLRPFGQDCPDELQGLTLGPMLGRGAHGKVYRGMWKGKQKVAVKILDCLVEEGKDLPDTDTGPVLEATLSKDLGRHPNVVQTLAWAIRKEEMAVTSKKHLQEVWIVEEYADHGTLNDAIDRGWLRTGPSSDAPPSMRSVLLTAQDIASALSFLHARHILHGDLAGGNVLLLTAAGDPRGFRAKVCDFGVARILPTDGCNTETMGTMTHMPPELLEGGLLGKATDVYSFGVLCHEMYTSSHAWAGHRLAHIVHAKTVLRQRLELPAGCPTAFQALVESCLSADHTQRPSFDEVLASLASMLLEFE